MATVPIPLFPLPVVLFPGTLIPLHIFELRYREMLTTIMEGDKRFGLLYHDPDESGPFMNEVGQVGTVAEVKKHQALQDGRSLILIRGLNRFQIREEVPGEVPYYQAHVDPFEDRPSMDEDRLVVRREKSLALFQQVLQNLAHVPETLPSFNVNRELSFKLAAVARMDTFWQQELLEMVDEEARLDRLDPVFRYGIDNLWEGGRPEA